LGFLVYYVFFIYTSPQSSHAEFAEASHNQIVICKSQIVNPSNPSNLSAHQPQTYPQSCHPELAEASHNQIVIRKSQIVNLLNPLNLRAQQKITTAHATIKILTLITFNP
jgi:hypothetical protein